MTKSIKNKKAVYNFLDAMRYNIEIGSSIGTVFKTNEKRNLLIINLEQDLNCDCDCNCQTQLMITQEIAKNLVTKINEFIETGDLK